MNLKQLSEILGISQTTISRALNGYPEVNKETRKRVESAAREHGYTPSSIARRLAGKKAEAVGLVLPRAPGHEYSVFLRMLDALADCLRSKNIELLVVPSGEGDDLQVYEHVRNAAQVDAFILMGLLRDDRRLHYLGDKNIRCIVHGNLRSIPTSFSYHDTDHRCAIRDAALTLLELGHKRIALLNPSDRYQFAWDRKTGFWDAYQARNFPMRDAFVLEVEQDGLASYNASLKAMAGDSAPTAFICSSIRCADGVVRAIETLNKAVGRDISVIAWNDGHVKPKFTEMSTIDAPIQENAERLSALVVGALRTNNSPPDEVLNQARLCLRASVGVPAL